MHLLFASPRNRETSSSAMDTYCSASFESPDANDAKLYVSTNGTVPATVTTHLHKYGINLSNSNQSIRRGRRGPRLPCLILGSGRSILVSTPSTQIVLPHKAQASWQQIIFEYILTRKFSKHYQKLGPKILERYEAIMKSLISAVVDST